MLKTKVDPRYVVEFCIIREGGKFAVIHPNSERHYPVDNVHEGRQLVLEWVTAWKLPKHEYVVMIPKGCQAKKA